MTERPIKNAIVSWNYLYLEMRLRTAEPAMQAEMMLAIKAHSPQSWAHVNILGEYDFSEDKLTDKTADFGGRIPKQLAANFPEKGWEASKISRVRAWNPDKGWVLTRKGP